jgi:hypothetical protein
MFERINSLKLWNPPMKTKITDSIESQNLLYEENLQHIKKLEKEISELNDIINSQKFALNTIVKHKDRAHYASMMMQGMLSNPSYEYFSVENDCAKQAINYANALIQELEKYYD